MGDQTSKPGPVLSETIEEVQGVFPNDAALQDAISRLTLAGFDRAAFSLPTTRPAASEATPEAGAAEPITDTDVRQARTMGTSMAGTIGAFAAAGATIATGGAAAVAIAAAAAVGAGSALAANAVGNAAGDSQSASRDAAASKGELILAVHAPTVEQREAAERIMREAGASSAAPVQREGGAVGGIDSSSWTG